MRPWAWLWIVGYLLGLVVVGRFVFVFVSKVDKTIDRSDNAFVAVLAAIMWPLLLWLVVVLAPLAALGWLVSRPTRRQRAAAAEARRVRRAAEVARLAREFDLPDGGSS